MELGGRFARKHCLGERALALKKKSGKATKNPAYFADPTAIISPKAKIGAGTKIWAYAQIREGAVVGKNCMIGNGVYIDVGVKIGNRVNVHNKALLNRNLIVEDDVFIGPAVCFMNDPAPRANVIRSLKGMTSLVKKGASIGANASISSEIKIGQHAMIGAASVVTQDVADFALVYGVPARQHGLVDKKGKKQS